MKKDSIFVSCAFIFLTMYCVFGANDIVEIFKVIIDLIIHPASYFENIVTNGWETIRTDGWIGVWNIFVDSFKTLLKVVPDVLSGFFFGVFPWLK